MNPRPPSRSAHTRRFAVAALAALGLSAGSARAVSIAAPPTFNPTPSSISYGQDNQGRFNYGGGTLSGSALAKGANGVTGVKFQGTPSFTDAAGGFSGQLGTITIFTLAGTASGTLNAADVSIPVSYAFTLATAGSTPVTITGFTLNVTLTTTSGTSPVASVTQNGGAGGYSGSFSVVAPGAASGANLSGYSASLTVSYSGSNASGGTDTLSVVIPANSIDLNAVPEPTTWVILAVGIAGAGLAAGRVRARRAEAA